LFDGFLNKAVSAKLSWLKGGHPHNICAKWFDKKEVVNKERIYDLQYLYPLNIG
jgi:hypothetical protein